MRDILTAHRSRFLASACVMLLALASVIAFRGSTEVISVSAYSPDHNPAAAVGFPDTSLVVVGTVASHGLARQANERHPLRMIYTPVRLTVTEVLKGSAQVGDTVMVRGIGGRVGNTIFSVDDIPSIKDLAVGSRVLVFLSDARDVGDGMAVQTPEFAYTVDEADIARHADSGVEAPLAEFRLLLKDSN